MGTENLKNYKTAVSSIVKLYYILYTNCLFLQTKPIDHLYLGIEIFQ